MIMSRRRLTLAALALLGIAAGIAFAPCTARVRDSEGWRRSGFQLHVIGYAIRNYYEANGHLPPAVVRGKDGSALFSWRASLLPFLEHAGLYNQLKLDEPWNSPHNAPLVAECPRCFTPQGGGLDAPGQTRYEVLVGPGTAFERERMTWNDFPNGLANTILVVESAQPVHWATPSAIEYAAEKPLPPLESPYRKPVHFLCREFGRHAGFNACFADGNCRFIRSDVDADVIRRLIIRNGQPFDASKLD